MIGRLFELRSAELNCFKWREKRKVGDRKEEKGGGLIDFWSFYKVELNK